MRRWLANILRLILGDVLDFAGMSCVRVVVGFCYGLGFTMAALLVIAFCVSTAKSETIPTAAAKHRAELTRCGRYVWGLDAPIATLAGQVHQESCWRTDAKSQVGARGLAQFMPATSRWIAGLVPELAANTPYNPGWALRALAEYDKWLWERVSARDGCQRMAMALAAYNGGLGWVQRDKRLAARNGADPLSWWDHVERFNAGRSAAAFRENRGYPRRILRILEPLYLSAGWGQGVCHE